jgi:Sel1 repeat
MERCRGGKARACYHAGLDHDLGRGTAKDHKRAADLYRQACETRSPSKPIAKACTNLGYLYDHGLGLKRNSHKASHYYRRGCDGGNSRGCNNLGVLYDHGKHGVTRDWAKAKRLFERACDAKLALACSNLGLVYRKGRGVKKDPRRAQKLFVTACGSKSSAGCRHAGWGALRGHAGKRNWPAALRHFALGCTLARSEKNRGSCRAQDRMRGLEQSLGDTGTPCDRQGLWNPQYGRLVALADAKSSRLENVTFASLGWTSNLLARAVIPRRAGAHPRVALDDGRIRLRALVIPTRSGYAPRFYLARQRQASPVLWLAPGLRLGLRGHGGGLLAKVQLHAVAPPGRQKMVVPLSCDEISLHHPAWKRPANWPAGGPSLGSRKLVISADVPLAAKPRGRTWAHVPKGKGTTKGSGPLPVKATRKKPPTLTVELLATRGSWKRIRYRGYRHGFVAWVRGKLLRPVARGGGGALASLLGGLGLSGRSRRGPKPRIWRCRREVPLSVRRPGAPPRPIGVLHPKTRFTVVATKSAVVTIRIPGLRWLRLHPKVELAIPTKALRTACAKTR